MYHLGQVILVDGVPAIYGGIDMKRNKGTLLIYGKEKTLWRKTFGEAIEKEGEQYMIYVGDFCVKSGLKWNFCGVLNCKKITEEGWDWISQTLNMAKTIQREQEV